MAVFSLEAVLTLATSQYDKGLKDAGGQLESFGNKLSHGLGVVAKATGAAIAAGATAVAALTKQAVEAYAEYEQLAGGIETLFGAGGKTVFQYAQEQGKAVSEVREEYRSLMSAQNEIMSNAEQAYKSAGLSTSEYMNLAIQSGASLIDSLGGDTQKAAQLMDMAIIDMADNVNKMGTTMEAVQNAYRGFSRGNFTMLDNLALGFAGTKEGMQALLDQAHQLSGIKYDINNYADIIQAIHVIQEQKGIAGTTLKEGATTISGSLNQVKASWKNLILGVADDNADFDSLVDNFVSSLTGEKEGEGLINQLAPRVTKALKGVGKLIEKLAPKAAEVLGKVLPDVLPTLISSGTGLISTIVSVLAENAPEIVGQITSALLENKDSIWEAIKELFKGGKEVLNGIGEELADEFPGLSFIFDDLGDKVGGVVTAILTLKGVMTATDWLSNATTMVRNLSGAFNGVGTGAAGMANTAGALGGGAGGGLSTGVAAGLAGTAVTIAYMSYMNNKEGTDYILSGGFGKERAAREEAEQRTWDAVSTMLSNAGLEASDANIQTVVSYDNLAEGIEALGYTWEEFAAMTREHKGEIDDAMSGVADAAEAMADGVSESAETTSDSIDSMSDAATEAADAMTDGMTEALSDEEVVEAMTVTADAIGAVLEELAASGYGYGADFIGGLISGFNSRKGEFVASAEAMAGDVRAMLHFSRPDEGPLADYETWMPDFMAGLAQGITDNSYRVHDALDDALGYASSAFSDGAGMTINHTGVIRLEGVNNEGELVAAADMVYDQIIGRLRQEVRYA